MTAPKKPSGTLIANISTIGLKAITALKQLLRPKRGFRNLSAAKNTLKGIETLRSIKKGHFANNETGVLNEIKFIANLFEDAA